MDNYTILIIIAVAFGFFILGLKVRPDVYQINKPGSRILNQKNMVKCLMVHLKDYGKDKPSYNRWFLQRQTAHRVFNDEQIRIIEIYLTDVPSSCKTTKDCAEYVTQQCAAYNKFLS